MSKEPVAGQTVGTVAEVHLYVIVETVIDLLGTLALQFLTRIGSFAASLSRRDGFAAFSGSIQTLSLKTVPSIRPSMQYLRIIRSEMFHFSAISEMVM